jgi:hypothetical protein
VAKKRVAFARINVRTAQGGFGDRTFRDEMTNLAAAGEMRVTVPNRESLVADSVEWVARDLALSDDGSVLSGLIGFATRQRIYVAQEDEQSWLKGEQTTPEAGSDDTLVPFAVDIRDDRRWVAFATAQKIRPAGFANAFQAALQGALEGITPFPSMWEVDLITDRSTIEEWLAEHPAVVVFRRTVRHPNPVRDLSVVHQEMADLHAKSKREEFRAYPGETLDVRADTDTLGRLLEGVDKGWVDAYFQAQGDGGTRPRFNTRLASDEEFVEDFRDDLSRGLDLVTRALRNYSARRAGEIPEPAEMEFDSDDDSETDE